MTDRPFSTLPGIHHITGEHDTGKTTLALECGAPPARIAFFDDDVKGRATVEDLRRAGVDLRYIDLVELKRGRTQLDFHLNVLDEIESLREHEPEAIIWDTWTYLAKTCRAYVGAYPDQFRKKGGLSKGGEWSDSGKFRGMQLWSEAKRYEAQLLNLLQSIAPTVIVITHLTDHYLNNVKTGKEVPDSSEVLERVCRTRIWLRHSPDGRPVPIALFLKRLDKKQYVEGVGLRTQNVTPRKITPRFDDDSIWDAIWRYWDNPMGDRPPLPEETPNAYELSILDGTLTEDQKRMMYLMLESGVVDTDDEDEGEMMERVPETWQDLLTMTGKTLGDLGGIEAASAMSGKDVADKWEEWKDDE